MSVEFDTYDFECPTTSRHMRLSVPKPNTPLPVITDSKQLQTMRDPPVIRFEVISDDGGDTTPMQVEFLEAIAFLELNDLIPSALAQGLRESLTGET